MVSMSDTAESDAPPAVRRARFHPLIIAEVRRETADAVSLAFDIPDRLRETFRFTPGQYLTLRTTVDGAELRRSYSICSGLDDGHVRVAVKAVAGGRFSGFANGALQPGQILDVMPPMGRFGVAPDAAAARTYLALACGSGITPILSVVKSVLAREPAARIVLLYGNRTAQGILFRDTLEALKDRHVERLSVTHILSREAQDVAVLNGRLDGDKIRRLVPTLVPPATVDHAFVCGPGAMIDDATTALQSLGIPPARIHAERFTPADDAPPPRPAAPVPAADRPHAVAEIVLDGSRLGVPVAPGEAILDAALRAGLDLPFSCRGGMCCTCRARVVEGAVEMAVNYSLQDWEIAAGFALTCQARPTTARVVVDYDQV